MAGIAAGDPSTAVGAWIARSVPCEPRGLTVSHACDPRMHRKPGILNRAEIYAKTVKLNPAISTQERCVEKPRAPPLGVNGKPVLDLSYTGKIPFLVLVRAGTVHA
jgi:hypothetical protein